MSTRDDWLKARRTGIGGSDVAPILGLSKWTTPMQVYLDKRGEGVEQEDNAAMRWGRYLEAPVRQAYADTTGREVRVPTELIRHPLHDFMIANLDGFTDDRRIFEAKTARSSEGWGEPGSADIPQAYLLQIQHYMEVTAYPIADVAVLIGGSDFRIYEVPADRELQDMIVEAEAEFWQRVQRGEPPEPVSVADMQAKWGRSSRAETAMANADALHAVLNLRDIKAQQQALEAAEEVNKAIVLRAMGECDTLVDSSGKTLATWKTGKPAARFDVALFRSEHPSLAAAFTRTGEPSRRFLLKS